MRDLNHVPVVLSDLAHSLNTNPILSRTNQVTFDPSLPGVTFNSPPLIPDRHHHAAHVSTLDTSLSREHSITDFTEHHISTCITHGTSLPYRYEDIQHAWNTTHVSSDTRIIDPLKASAINTCHATYVNSLLNIYKQVHAT